MISPWLLYHCYSVRGSLEQAVGDIDSSDTVYLAGPINGCSDQQAIGWRAEAKRLLPCVLVLDPMDRDYRGRESDCAAEIIHGDKQSIAACTALLVNANRPSWGTAMEIMFAYQLCKRIVAFVEQK